MKGGFQFRQFFVRHDRSSMKVGTDGVLIGAWAPTRSAIAATDAESGIKSDDASALPTTTFQVASGTPIRILDVGTGSGLIALMLAQRCPEAQIDAIDIDEASCLQARENFDASPWAELLHAAHSSLQEWAQNRLSTFDFRLSTNGYDLIVSNPPYFVDSLKAPAAARCAARHNDTLPFSTLIAESARLLNPNGTLAVIVPCEAEETLQALAADEGLQCTQRCYVHSKPGRAAKRVLIAWQKNRLLSTDPTELTERIVLEDAHGGRSPEYQQLTQDFYL